MKSSLFTLLISLSILFPAASQARDTLHRLPFDTVVQSMMAEHKLDGSVKFYLAGNTPNDTKIIQSGVVVNKKTNAVNKSDQAACNWALESALLSLQDSAKQVGAQSVVNIVSFYKRNEYSDPRNYECHAGTMMAGIILKADLAN